MPEPWRCSSLFPTARRIFLLLDGMYQTFLEAPGYHCGSNALRPRYAAANPSQKCKPRNCSRCSELAKALQLLSQCATAGRASQGPKVRVKRYPRDLQQGFSPSSPSLVVPKAREGTLTLALPIETTRANDRNHGRRTDRCGVSNL